MRTNGFGFIYIVMVDSKTRSASASVIQVTSLKKWFRELLRPPPSPSLLLRYSGHNVLFQDAKLEKLVLYNYSSSVPLTDTIIHHLSFFFLLLFASYEHRYGVYVCTLSGFTI